MSRSPAPVSRWGEVWRTLLVLAVSGVSWWEMARWQLEHAPAWFVADGVVGLACLVLVRWRRRFPVAVALVTNLATMGSYSSGGPALLALVSLGTRRRWREIVPVFAVTAATVPVVLLTSPVSTNDPRVDFASIVVALALAVAWGLYIGSRRELLLTLRSRAESAEAEQAAKVAQARTAERARIAREMHDVLAHRISLVTMHAGALAYRDDLPAEQVRETARTIQETSHLAMTELRTVLGVLRDGPGDAVPELPQPAACDLPELVEEWRRAGLNVRLDTEADLTEVPPVLGRTVFRVVQEGLTNAHKHAAATSVHVSLDVRPEESVHVLVDNPLQIGSHATLPGSGLGLVGLSERVALAGGRLEHCTTPDRRFVLEVWLPWRT